MTVSTELDDHGVLEITVHSTPVNAYGVEDLKQLAAVVDSVAHRSEIRGVVLRGTGRGFCAGGDVKEVQKLPAFEGLLGQANGSQNASLAIARCPVPVVAAIHGYCIGVGVLLAGTCDIVVAAAETVFVLAEADNGATAGAVQAIGLLPDKRLRAAMMTCEPVQVDELHRYGSVYAIEDGLDATIARARTIARTIAAKNPDVMRRLKLSMNGSLHRDLEMRYRQELSYTYELNMLGHAENARVDFIEDRRASYIANNPDVKGIDND